MSAHNSVADIKSESHPEYSGKLQDTYIDGYDPVSLSAPHSSLVRSSTWIGMGLVMASLAFVGTLLWGIGTGIWGTGTATDHSSLLMIIGGVGAVVGFGLGFGLIFRGRRYYREYREETGRQN
ncbi:hypothetical protein [Corynebacterium lubricantis]|uniref:hypothetical protein n=1 Tax=Corynebacterium lubricantis TaxID=541095 RepID=UPI0003727B79|nr:hypothetical protein [Corynebacterium lubricantis]